MMHVHIDAIPPESQYLRECAAVKRRLMGRPTVDPGKVQCIETSSSNGRKYDAHLKDWLTWQRIRPVGPLHRYIVERCIQLGANYEQIIGPSCKRHISDDRHLIAWEIKTIVKPNISYPQLGRIFGGRDHTTMLHAVKKIDAMKRREKANAD